MKELTQRVEALIDELERERKDHERSRRLLLAAEAKIRELQSGGGANGVTVLDLNRKIEKMRSERKIIKSKVEKMVERLDRFYKEN